MWLWILKMYVPGSTSTHSHTSQGKYLRCVMAYTPENEMYVPGYTHTHTSQGQCLRCAGFHTHTHTHTQARVNAWDVLGSTHTHTHTHTSQGQCLRCMCWIPHTHTITQAWIQCLLLTTLWRARSFHPSEVCTMGHCFSPHTESIVLCNNLYCV